MNHLFVGIFLIANYFPLIDAGHQIPLYQFRRKELKGSDGKVDKSYWHNYANDLLLTNVTLGTPPKIYWLTIESGNRYMWLIDQSCPDATSKQDTYNPSHSSTSQLIRSNFSTQSGKTRFLGNAYTDKAIFFYEFSQAFGSITKIQSEFDEKDLEFDGGFGIAWGPFDKGDSDYKYLSPIVNLLSIYPPQLNFYTIWLGGHQKPSSAPISNGLITLGSFDTKHCNYNNIDYVKLNIDDSSPYMRFTINGFSTSKYSLKSTAEGYLDSGSPTIQMSLEAYSIVYGLLKPEYDYENQLLTIDCDASKKFDDWLIGIGDKEYKIGNRNYVLDLELPNNQCAVAFALSEDNKSFVLGNPMLRSYCTLYELAGQRVGFLALN